VFLKGESSGSTVVVILISPVSVGDRD